ncbi:MAG: VOC family protein, partial [Deltaproteobacteria bacterium]|nr:VOC family protein [Deltaproteobacteria bacterium]
MSQEKSPVKVKKIGHVVFSVKDIEASTKFWTEIMGLHVTDRNEHGMVFFRNATDHHTIALAPAAKDGEVTQGGQPGFHHIAFEVATVSE